MRRLKTVGVGERWGFFRLPIGAAGATWVRAAESRGECVCLGAAPRVRPFRAWPRASGPCRAVPGLRANLLARQGVLRLDGGTSLTNAAGPPRATRRLAPPHQHRRSKKRAVF